SNGSLVSLPGGVTVDLTYETTDLTIDVPGDVTEATGNVLADDALGSGYTSLAVMNELGEFVMPGAGGVTVVGDYGVLTIMSNGDYTYTPNADLTSIGFSDTFTYQLQDPNGGTVTATLTIDVEETAGAAIAGIGLFAVGDDVVGIDDLEVASQDDPLDGGTQSTSEALALTLDEGDGQNIPLGGIDSLGDETGEEASLDGAAVMPESMADAKERKSTRLNS